LIIGPGIGSRRILKLHQTPLIDQINQTVGIFLINLPIFFSLAVMVILKSPPKTIGPSQLVRRPSNSSKNSNFPSS
jgi:hypothetical protein